MTIAEIIAVVTEVTGVKVDKLGRKMPTYYTYSRYVAIVLMEEEGYKNTAIAASLNIAREHTHRALKKAEYLFETEKADSAGMVFKKIYLACVARLSKMEETI